MTDLRRSSSNDVMLMLRVLRHVHLTTGFGRRTARAADSRQWSEMKSASDTVTLVTRLTLLAARMSSRLATPGSRRVGWVTSCVRPTESRPSLSSTSTDESSGRRQLASPHVVRALGRQRRWCQNVDGVDIHCGRYRLRIVNKEPAVPTLSSWSSNVDGR